MADRLGDAGARPQKEPTYAPIFVAASLTGLYTQRHVFHDPSNVVTQRFYGGRPDVLWDGLNIELSNELTLIRRFGCSQFSATTYPQAPTCAFSFELDDGSIQVLIDTPSFVYWDEQNGSKATVFTKGAGAGQGYFVAAGNTLYYGDGVDTLKYTPGNANGTVWNWGITAPTNPPTVTPVPSGAAAVPWTASTFYSTMGLLVDSNNNIEWLTSVNTTGTNTTQYGHTGQGFPPFSLITGGTFTENGSGASNLVWTCKGPLQLWIANHTYAAKSCIYVPATSVAFVAFLQSVPAGGGTPIPTTAPNGIRLLTYPGETGGGIFCTLFGGTSGDAQPKWNPTTDTGSVETTGLQWNYLGAAVLWQHNETYNSFWEWSNEVVVTPTLPNVALLQANTQTIYVQTANDATIGHNNNQGTSATTGYTPQWAASANQTTGDGDLVWVNLGSKTWAASTDYFAWAPGTAGFSALVDGNGNFQVCLVSGQSSGTIPLNGWRASTVFATNATIGVQSASGYVEFHVTSGGGGSSGSTEPNWDYVSGHTTSDGALTWTSLGAYSGAVWAPKYGGQTSDGSVTWANCGTAANSTWVANTQWYLPSVGFAPPTLAQPYGGAEVIANGDVQAIIGSGLSGVYTPAWGTIGSNTQDNTATWYTISATSVFSLSWTVGYTYAYSFGARLATDPFNTTAPPGWGYPLGNPTGALTGGISTASPVAILTGANSGAVNTVTGVGSSDPQVDTIYIWRSPDQFSGSANMLLLTEIPNPLPVNGQPQPWTFKDYLPDVATSQFPGLNTFVPAPIDHENDPPPAGFLPLCNKLHFTRIFGAVGNTVFFSGGPDIITGNPNESFNPDDDFPFQSTVIACIHTPTGLICPTTTDFECIYGGPATASFYDDTMLPGVGMLSYNAWDIYGGEIYFVSSDSQLWSVTPATQLARVGFPIGNKLAAFNAADVYLTVHESGTDNAIYVGDGSTGWYRLNPHQVGADTAGENSPVWSPKAAIVGGCQMLQSVVTAPGVHTMLIGGTGTNEHIQKRDQTVFADSGSAYEAWGDIGAITMVFPGQRAAVKFVEMDFMSVGTQPTVSFLLDDPTPSPSWNALTNYVFDPPIVYAGANITPNYWPDRFYINQTQDVAVGRRIRLKFDFGNTDTVRNELISFAIFGKKYVEQ